MRWKGQNLHGARFRVKPCTLHALCTRISKSGKLQQYVTDTQLDPTMSLFADEMSLKLNEEEKRLEFALS